MAKKSSPQVSNWVMPKPSRGQVVRFYYNCTVSKRNTDIAFVRSVSERSVDLAFQGQAFNECYHRDDPRVKANPDLRQDIGGLWEFTEETIETNSRISSLESRIEKLEKALGSVTRE